MNGQLGCRKTWQLFRHLLDPIQTKSTQRSQLTRLMHQYEGTTTEFLADLQQRYLNTTQRRPLPDYQGFPNPEMDADIVDAEVWYALSKLRTTSAAGPDGVTNKTPPPPQTLIPRQSQTPHRSHELLLAEGRDSPRLETRASNFQSEAGQETLC